MSYLEILVIEPSPSNQKTINDRRSHTSRPSDQTNLSCKMCYGYDICNTCPICQETDWSYDVTEDCYDRCGDLEEVFCVEYVSDPRQSLGV